VAQERLVQLLTPEGELVEDPEYSIEISTEELRALYRDLVMVRRFDIEATALQRQGELGLWAQSLGQEAAQVGSGRALEKGDYAFPTYREHGVAWCKGVDPVKLLGMFRGVNHGGWDPNENNFHLYTVVIGAQTLHATGYAMGLQRDKSDRAVIAYFGDGATSQGDVNEAFVFASVYLAPVVFFCQNNQWAISQPIEGQTRVPLYRRASGFGFPGIRVGEGPTFIEAFTYRMGAHTTSDDPSRYRLAKDLEAWKLKDPIERVKVHLARTGQGDSVFFAEVDAEAEKMAAQLRARIIAMPDPDPDEMFAHVYAEPHEPLAKERANFSAYRASFLDQA
jgi:2-oxoisovalerate dehydrogenase E1 component alpha subunit